MNEIINTKAWGFKLVGDHWLKIDHAYTAGVQALNKKHSKGKITREQYYKTIRAMNATKEKSKSVLAKKIHREHIAKHGKPSKATRNKEAAQHRSNQDRWLARGVITSSGYKERMHEIDKTYGKSKTKRKAKAKPKSMGFF